MIPCSDFDSHRGGKERRQRQGDVSETLGGSAKLLGQTWRVGSTRGKLGDHNMTIKSAVSSKVHWKLNQRKN